MSSDGDTVIIGATGSDGTGNKAGHARVYRIVPPAVPMSAAWSLAGLTAVLAGRRRSTNA